MENRRLIAAVLLALGLVLLWQPALIFIGSKFWDLHPKPTTQVSEVSTTQPTTQMSAQPAAPATAVATGPLRAATTAPAVSTILGSAAAHDPQYKMAVTLSSQGAGIDSVQLNEFTKTAQGKDAFVFEQPYAGQEAASRPLATRSIVIDGAAVDLAAENWTLEHSDSANADYSLTIMREGKPAIRARKTFQLLPASDPSQGYELQVSQAFENLTDQPVKLRATFNGPTLPPQEVERGSDRQVVAGFAAKNGVIQVNHNVAEEFTKDKPNKSYTTDTNNDPLVWAGTASVYFNAIVRPLGPDDATAQQNAIAAVEANTLDPVQHLVVMAFDLAEQSLAPHQSMTQSSRAFFGPRQRKLLESDYYAAFPRAFDQTLVLTSGICGYLTFQWLISLLVGLLRVLHVVFLGDWGLAIIGLVIIVRVILHPVTRRSQIAMSRMSKMGPEVERLKKKYGDNKDELNKAMMGLYKEQGVAPILGCLPMLLQMPVWMALWQSLQTTFELRHASFLWGLTWIHDLSKPDHLMEWTPFPFFFLTISGLNVLPLIMGGIFWLQMKYQPKPASITPEQQQQQKMMQWMMPVLFPLMLYSGPSGLNLYILTSTGIGIIESKIIRDHLKQREEAEKSGRVIVDAGKKFKSSGDRFTKGLKQDKPKSGKFATWLAGLQDKAEQIRRDAEKRGK